jgi:hypothetical protein
MGFASGRGAGNLRAMAIIDVAGFVADLKNHAADHGFHVHDERHFVETYSMRQSFEVDLHPEEACGGPLEFHLSVDVEPRTLLAFEDALLPLPEGEEPEEDFELPLSFTWSLPPLPHGPDLLLLATELAGIGGPDLPVEVSAVDSFQFVTDPSVRTLTVVSRLGVSMWQVYMGEEMLCDVLERCLDVSRFLLESAPAWIDEP